MAQYTPKTWTTGETITAAELNAIEQAAAAALPIADIPTSAALRAAFGSRRTSQPLLRPVAWRANHLGAAFYLTPAGIQTGSFRVQHVTVKGLRAGGIRLLYANHVGGEFAWNPLTVSAHVEIDGRTYPVLFGGSRTVTVPPGGFVISDPLAISIYPETGVGGSGAFYTMTYVNAGSGGRIPLGIQTTPGNGEGNNIGDSASGGGDLTVATYAGTPTTAPLVAGGAYSPSAILGLGDSATLPAVCVMGDSIAVGQGDSGPSWTGGGNPSGDLGFIARALQDVNGPKIPYLYFARYGETAVTAADSRNQRAYILDYCTDVVDEYGSNDVDAGSPASTIEQVRTRLWMAAASRGKRVWACTTTPRSTSTDSWATVGNQTKHSNDAARTVANDWLRAGAPLDPSTYAPVAVGTSGAVLAGQGRHPLAGYFEIADTVESARNSGVWKASYTTDGVHPNATASAAAAAAIDPGKFAI